MRWPTTRASAPRCPPSPSCVSAGRASCSLRTSAGPRARSSRICAWRPWGSVSPNSSGEPVVALREPAPDALPDAPVVLLENLRFDPGEETDDPAFAGRLAELADVYVDDAFGAVHRAHASVSALPDLMLASGRAAVAGRLMQREVEVLSTLLHEPDRPYVAILGGAKVSDKLAVIDVPDRPRRRVADRRRHGVHADRRRRRSGRQQPRRARPLRRCAVGARARCRARRADRGAARRGGGRRDLRWSRRPRPCPPTRSRDGLMGLDIGPKTVARYADDRSPTPRPCCGTARWASSNSNPSARAPAGSPMAVANADAFTVVGGGDSLLAVKRAELHDGFDHLSTGGGASLEFLEGRELPGITILEDRTMTERRPIIAANWKMHKTHLEAIQAVQKFSYLLDKDDAEKIEVVICPPFTALRSVETLLDSDKLPYGLGAQNVYPEDKGAFTGEVSPLMLAALRVRLRHRGTLRASAALRRGRRLRQPEGARRLQARDDADPLRRRDAGGARGRRHGKQSGATDPAGVRQRGPPSRRRRPSSPTNPSGRSAPAATPSPPTRAASSR